MQNGIQQLLGLRFNNQGLINEQIFDDQLHATAYHVVASIVNQQVHVGDTQQRVIALLQPIIGHVSALPFFNSNRITVTQALTTVFYNPFDVYNAVYGARQQLMEQQRVDDDDDIQLVQQETRHQGLNMDR